MPARFRTVARRPAKSTTQPPRPLGSARVSCTRADSSSPWAVSRQRSARVVIPISSAVPSAASNNCLASASRARVGWCVHQDARRLRAGGGRRGHVAVPQVGVDRRPEMTFGELWSCRGARRDAEPVVDTAEADDRERRRDRQITVRLKQVVGLGHGAPLAQRDGGLDDGDEGDEPGAETGERLETGSLDPVEMPAEVHPRQARRCQRATSASTVPMAASRCRTPTPVR
jgi:hypothetical protein